MSPVDDARMLKALESIADSLKKIEEHLQPYEGTTTGGRPYKLTLAGALDRVGDLILAAFVEVR